jgi:hypothetical protein
MNSTFARPEQDRFYVFVRALRILFHVSPQLTYECSRYRCLPEVLI